MTCIDNTEFEIHARQPDVLQRVWGKLSETIAQWLESRATKRQQKIDRVAFLNLMGKEDWLYRDMGIHEGDVVWASRLPLEINAAKELEKIRLLNRKNV